MQLCLYISKKVVHLLNAITTKRRNIMTKQERKQLEDLYTSLQFFIDRRSDGDATGEHIAVLGLIGEKERLGNLLGKPQITYTVTMNDPSKLNNL